ncbi:MAG: F0F1 ATP synthase subunit epsilon [Desulfovibrionaceae bacterium]|nr:F0F1 ATP synthase subunit epsilon [Desulfovibrionaceae bacterium]
MEKGIHLSIVTPDDVVFDAPVSYVGIPGTLGDFGVYPGHAALLSSLRTGCLTYKTDERTVNVFVSGGFVDVTKESVTILADAANPAEQIDIDRAAKAKERAEARLKDATEEVDVKRAEAALRRAVSRLNVAATINK